MAARSEQDKLRLLLPHWIEHNEEHANEFRRWAEKAGPAQADILSAADDLEKVNQTLARALEKLGGPLEHPEHAAHA
ncbi:MAG: hypothetical protein H5T68_00880 [Chloroflexi bacterium]|nr:hypothetical protein [Chloroflexota bacterium]